MINYRKSEQLSGIQNFFYRYSIFFIIGAVLLVYFSSKNDEEQIKGQLNLLEEEIQNGQNRKVIELADKFLADYKKGSQNETFIRYYRGAAFYNLQKFQKAFEDINLVTERNGRGSYYLYYTRAKLRDQLTPNDTSAICSDVTRAINSKGAKISRRNLPLNSMDSTDCFDVNYVDMLKLRVKYCEKLMPLKIKVDRELITKAQQML